MWEIIAGIILVAFIVFIVWYNKFYKKSLKIRDTFYRAINTPQSHTTPMGAIVRAEKGVELSQEALVAIDNGIIQNAARVERLKPHYRRKFVPSDFIVAVFEAELATNGLPVFKVPIPKDSPYYHTEYNKGTKDNPYVWASGQMIAVGNPYGNVIAVPAPITNDLEYLSTGVDYECEHIQAAWNEPSLFEATKYHIGDGHPIYRESLGFAMLTSDFECAPAIEPRTLPEST